MKNFFKKFYLGIILVFLYVPIVVLICQSFNAGKSRAKWEGFSFRWYGEAVPECVHHERPVGDGVHRRDRHRDRPPCWARWPPSAFTA